jgi:hypothetical protein
MEIISVHVPKTAGTTFGNMLLGLYGAESIHMDYDDWPMNPSSLFHTDRDARRARADEEVRRIGPQSRVVHGHFCAAKYRGVFPEARRIAWVRHPVAWLISLYHFWIDRARDPQFWAQYPHQASHRMLVRLRDQEISLEEFAEHPEVRDCISRTFLDRVDLDQFFFVGIQEHFREDLRELIGRMGWPQVEVGADNANPARGYHGLVQRYRDDRALMARLEALNAADMDLYERALALRARRRGGSVAA